MENIGQKKPCEEKQIYTPKIALENAFNKRGYQI